MQRQLGSGSLFVARIDSDGWAMVGYLRDGGLIQRVHAEENSHLWLIYSCIKHNLATFQGENLKLCLDRPDFISPLVSTTLKYSK